MGTIYNSGQASEGISGRPQQNLGKTTDLQERGNQGQVDEIALLGYVFGSSLEEWFTAQDIFQRLKDHQNITLDEIEICLSNAALSGLLGGQGEGEGVIMRMKYCKRWMLISNKQ